MVQYKELHDEFYGGKHFNECNRHQGEIGYRRDFAADQIRSITEPREEYQSILCLYSRTYKWWEGRHRPKVCLISDNIKEYADKSGVN